VKETIASIPTSMITTRPCVSELSLLHYAKPIHPEFFRVVASRTVERSDYTLTVNLTSTGHVAEFRTTTHDNNRAYSKLVWSHKGNKVATNGSGKTPDQFSNWSKRFATEVVTSAHFEMPGSPVSALRFKDQRHETFCIVEHLEVETTFGCETLDRKAFLAVQSELVKANELDGLFYHFGPNGRIALGGLSYLALETRSQHVRIRAYHTFPESCRVLTTDTTMEVKRSVEAG